MLASRPLLLDGRWIGIALRQRDGWRLIARHPGLARLEGRRFAALAEAEHACRRALAGRLPTGPAG